MTIQPQTDSLPAFVSRQVTEARRFFLNLDPNRRSPLEIVCGGVERMHHEYVVERTDFPYFAIEVVAEGEGTLELVGHEYRLSAGSVFAYGPRTHHLIRNRNELGMRKYYLDFVGTGAGRLLSDTGLKSGPQGYAAMVVGRLHELTDVFEMLIRDANDNGPNVSSIAETLTRLLFLKIQQLKLPDGSEMPQAYATYERIRRRIDADFLSWDTARDVADACGITPVHLSRLFRRFADCGAYQYLLRRKMNYAAGLLMNEGLMVKEVAKRMNFNDPFQFSRSFKRVYGVAPTKLDKVNR